MYIGCPPTPGLKETCSLIQALIKCRLQKDMTHITSTQFVFNCRENPRQRQYFYVRTASDVEDTLELPFYICDEERIQFTGCYCFRDFSILEMSQKAQR
jgi:hypothetical protein